MTLRSTAQDGERGLRYRILVVDDDLESLRYVGSLLKMQGFRVHIAGEGRLAIDVAREVQPDLILLDIRMPGLDGIETCRILKRTPETCRIPVVFLTGRGDEPSVLDAFDAGAADYVVKPFEPRVLLARVRTHAELGILSRGLERALSERTQALRDANAALRRLATEVSLAEEAEKARLAAELHDGPMQKLALAQMQIDAGAGTGEPPDGKGRPPPGRSSEGRKQLAAGLALLREAVSELRALQFELSPPVLHQRGLPAALDWLASNTCKRWGVAFNCVADGNLANIDRERSVILFLCARELVHNVIKHAGARSGTIALAAEGDMIVLTITDDGRGFDASAREAGGPETRGGYGLYSIRERLALLGGSLTIHSDTRGSRLTIRLPVIATTEAGPPPRDGVLKLATAGKAM